MAAESLNESITGLGPLGNFANDAAGAGAFKTFNLLISQIVAFLTVGGAIWFIIQIFIGALGWLSAGGDKQPLETKQLGFQTFRNQTGLINQSGQTV